MYQGGPLNRPTEEPRYAAFQLVQRIKLVRRDRLIVKVKYVLINHLGGQELATPLVGFVQDL
jgi:hypothetical protein